MAIYRSARPKLPTPDGVNTNGAWYCLFGLVEALYLCGFSDEAAKLSPLVETALERGPDWDQLRRTSHADPRRPGSRGRWPLGGGGAPLRSGRAAREA